MACRHNAGPLGSVSSLRLVSRLAPVEADVLRERLAQVIASARGYTVVHSCAQAVPFGIISVGGHRTQVPADIEHPHRERPGAP
jgi:hypothetical protein